MSSKRNITYKCPYCDKRFNKENLVIHVGDVHDDMIPQGYTAFRVVFDYINKKPAGYNGKCIICGKDSGWDENKGKYNRLCSNPECKKKYIKSFEDRMMNTKGVTRISSTADGQAKMLANRKISGEYKFQDGGIRTYTGTYEKKALEFMDKVMNIKSEDVTTPGPILEYMFEGKKHIYISDIYYAPYNLIIEVKDGGDNPNNRNMPEYRAKQIAKEKYIIKETDYNYLRLTNNDFSQLLAAFMELKMEMSNDTPERVIRINEGIITDRLQYPYKYGEAKKINKELADKINSTDYPWYFINITELINSGVDINLYGFDEEPIEGVNKSKYKRYHLYNKKVKTFYGRDSLNPSLRKYSKFNKGAAKTKDVVLKEDYIEEISRSSIKSDFLEKGDSCYNLDKWPNQYNILFVTGISGSGKTTLGIDLAKEFNARRVELDYIAVYYLRKCKERNAYDKFRNLLAKDCPEAVEFFDLNPVEKYGLREKWADTGDILKDFCNWFVTKFSNNGKSYIINGSYLYEIFDTSFYYDKPLIIKDINLIKTVFRRTWREFIDHKDDKFFNRLESAYKALKTGLSKSYRKANKDFKSYKKDMDKNAELVEEGFLKSEPDILYNKEAFDNGDINICFITGHSGSGKSTLAHSKESDTVEVYELDDLMCIKDHFTMDNLKEYGELIYTFFKKYSNFYKTFEELEKEKIPGSEYEDKLYPGFVDYAIKWAKNHKNKKYIVEGVWLYCHDDSNKPYFEPSYFKDYAFYIKGTSAIKSIWRSTLRDSKDTSNILQRLWILAKPFSIKDLKWYKLNEKDINRFRDYFKNKPETVLSEAYSGELGKIQRDPEIIDSYGFISSNGIYNENVKIKGFNKWLRGRSELFILDGDKVYLRKDPKKGYSIPGGGWEKDEDHNLSAIRETNEEARIKVKNVSYICSYVSFFDPKDWVKEKISKENWWYGEYIELYIGEYDGEFKGKVEKIDQDKAMENGKFYDIKSIYKDLIPVHQEALNDIINEAMSWKESDDKIKSIKKIYYGLTESESKKKSLVYKGNNKGVNATLEGLIKFLKDNDMQDTITKYVILDIDQFNIDYNIKYDEKYDMFCIKTPFEFEIKNPKDINYSISETKDASAIEDDFKKKSGKSFKLIDLNTKEALKYVSDKWQTAYRNTRFGRIAVCKEDDKLAGYIYWNKSGTIGPLEVYKDYRGYGLSETLMKEAIKNGGNKLGVYSDNEVAIRLYKKLGFVETGRKKYKDGDEVIIMELKSSLNEASMSNYKFLDIKSNKSKALEYLKANSETKSYAEDTVKNYNGELVIYNDTMIGRILVGDKKDKGFITDFSIDEEHRGNKLGSKLIDDAINKYHGVDLVVDKDNKLAIDMYKKRGFVIVKTNKNMGDQYYMKLKSNLDKDDEILQESIDANEYNPLYLISMSYKSPLEKPIELFTGSKYAHSSLVINNDFNNMYSFNGDSTKALNKKFLGGFSSEPLSMFKEINPEGIMTVSVLFLRNKEYGKLLRKINKYKSNASNTHYNLIGLINVPISRKAITNDNMMFCSQFVDYMLKNLDINLTGKSSNLISPKDIANIKDNKVYNVYTGAIKDFNEDKCIALTKKISKKSSTKYIKEGTIETEALTLYYEKYIDDKLINTEAMNALMTGYIPGSVDNPNNVYIVNYMQNNVFSGEDPNEDCIGVSDNLKLTNLIVRDNGILRRVDESFLKDKEYKVYILEMSREEVNNKLSKYMDTPVDKYFIYETLTGHKLYTEDQIQFESSFIPVTSYEDYINAFKEVCDNYFMVKDKKSIDNIKNTFIPKEARYFNESGLMYSEKVYSLDDYISSTKPKINILECLDISVKEGRNE